MIISIVTQVVNAFSDPVIGIISDRVACLKYRRKPYIVIALILMPASYLLLFTDYKLGTKQSKLLYYISMLVVFNISETLLDVPHAALAMDVVDEDKIRNCYLAFSGVLYAVGSLLGPASITVMEKYVLPDDEAKAFFYSSCIAAIVCFICILSVILFVTEKKTSITPKSIKEIAKESVDIMRVKSYWTFTLFYICSQIGIQTVVMNLKFYIRYVIKFV